MNLKRLFSYCSIIVVIVLLVMVLFNYQTEENKTMAQGVFWIGQNGNLYIKGSGGVTDTGTPTAQSIAATRQNYSEIADPSTGGGGALQVQQPAGPAAPSAAQLDPLFASLGSLDTILANKNAQSNDEYNRAIEGYNEADALDAKSHGQQVFQNEDTLTSNNQRALLNAANASTGLRGVLSSLGGLAGSGADIVKKLVGLAANEDTGAARDTFETNAGSVNSAWEQAERAQRQRREDAGATLENNMQNNQAGVLNSRKSIFEQLANVYGDDAVEGKNYASQAAALAAPIAATTRATVAPYAKGSSLFSPAALKDYLAGTQNLQVSTAPGAEAVINSPSYAANRKKDQLAGVA